MIKKIFTGLTLLLAATQVQARGIDLRLANEVAAVQYLTTSSTFGYGGADVGLGFLFNDANDSMFSAEAMVSGNGAGNNRALKMGVGAKVIGAYVKALDDTMGAVAIGAQVRYVIPSSAPIAIMAEGFIAPKIVSFSGADQYSEFRVAVELEVTPSARAYVGYRSVGIDITNGVGSDYKLDDSAHVGVRISF